jgi:hypothetical protein
MVMVRNRLLYRQQGTRQLERQRRLYREKRWQTNEGREDMGRKGGREGGRGAHAPKSEKELGNGLDDVLVKNVRDNECHASIIPPAVREKEGAEEAKLGNGVVGGIDSLGDGGRS